MGRLQAGVPGHAPGGTPGMVAGRGGISTCRTPGIIPRNTTMDDAEAAANSQSTRTQTVNGTVINLKWRYTCRTWRPPRAAHWHGRGGTWTRSNEVIKHPCTLADSTCSV